MKIRLAALCALLLPATALAQAPPDAAPNTPAPAPAPPTAESTPPPTVIVNPPPQVRRMVVTTMPEPEYETIHDSYNEPLFATGAVIFLASYGASVVVAAASDDVELDRGNDRLYVPVLGPWLALNDRGSCPSTSSACRNETTTKVLLVADGIFQAAGVITMIDGILLPSTHRVPVQPASNKLRVTPTVVGTVTGTPGLALSGSF